MLASAEERSSRDAMQILQAAEALDPDALDPSAHYVLARELGNLQRYDEAIERLDRYREAGGSPIEASLLRGQLAMSRVRGQRQALSELGAQLQPDIALWQQSLNSDQMSEDQRIQLILLLWTALAYGEQPALATELLLKAGNNRHDAREVRKIVDHALMMAHYELELDPQRAPVWRFDRHRIELGGVLRTSQVSLWFRPGRPNTRRSSSLMLLREHWLELRIAPQQGRILLRLTGDQLSNNPDGDKSSELFLDGQSIWHGMLFDGLDTVRQWDLTSYFDDHTDVKTLRLERPRTAIDALFIIKAEVLSE
jgi:tetratricopeptide (TPR) repeat protein